MSINGFVLKAIRQSLGFEKRRIRAYDDLDHLSGIWSEREAKEFQKNTAAFEEIDEKMWR